MFWIVLTCGLLFLLMWLLIAPIYLHIEWNEERQYVQFHWLGLFRLRLAPEAGGWYFQFRILGLHKRWALPPLRTTPAAKKTEKKISGWRPKHPFRLAKRLLYSFRILRCRLALDTGDFLLNTYLWPVFNWLKGRKKLDWSINFQGRSDFSLLVQNRLVCLLFAFFR